MMHSPAHLLASQFARDLHPASGRASPPGQAEAMEKLPKGRGETILMVDDEPVLREIVQTFLGQSGYKVLLAEDGPAALAIFAAQSAEIDLVLTDLAMPVMTGLALAETLRQMDAEVQIVISTGRENDLPAGPLAAHGVNATLTKPYNQSALLRLLDQILHATSPSKL